MEYSPICSLLRETIILIRSFSSNFNSAKRNAVASDFIHDLEKNKATNIAGKWTGESEVRALRFSPHILGNRCEHHFKTMHEVAFGIVNWVNIWHSKLGEYLA